MLEFIVLGQVPGTNIVVTYSWVLAIGTMIVGFSMFQRTHKLHNHSQTQNIDEITL